MPEAVIVATARSPIGRAHKGSLTELRPDDLTATIIKTALDKVPQLDPRQVEDLYLGCGLPGGEQGFNMARVVAILLGLDKLPAATITRYCASSLQSTRMAFHAIKAGEGDVFVSAGVEMVSRYARGNSDVLPPDAQAAVGGPWNNPAFLDAKARTDSRTVENTPVWTDPRADGHVPDVYIAMGQTAENLAQICNVSREEMDEFGVRSQNLAEKAIADGFWAREITPVTLPDGTVTAGNCCPLNDGAAAVIIMSDSRARELGIQPLARIISTGLSALSPEIMGLGPVEASRQALARAGMSIADVDLVEINEAFAAQVIPSAADLGIDWDKLNVNGGAIAVGHPFGMTGARITTTLINSLQWHDKQIGLETMCVGGGQGMAMIIERLS